MGTGYLTTHVLDTANGRPAAGMSIRLYRHGDRGAELLCSRVTNGDGRCDSPLLEGDGFVAGPYELQFEVGTYFASLGTAGTDVPFLDMVPVRFGIAQADAHYHVPLLVSPFAFSTYRGS